MQAHLDASMPPAAAVKAQPLAFGPVRAHRKALVGWMGGGAAQPKTQPALGLEANMANRKRWWW